MCRRLKPHVAPRVRISGSCSTQTALGASTRRSRWRDCCSRLNSHGLRSRCGRPRTMRASPASASGRRAYRRRRECSGPFDVRAMLDANAVDIIQPSVAKIGASPGREIAAVAEAVGARFVPHCPISACLLASLHLGAALAPRRHSTVVRGPGSRVPITSYWRQGRAFAVPSGPGLGRDPDLDILRRYALSAPTVLRA